MRIRSTPVAALLLAALLAPLAPEAQAARVGGGKSVGQQAPRQAQREAPPAQPGATPATPAQGTAAPQPAARQQPAAAGAQAPQPAPSRWGGMLGGLAAGLGLAWLAHSLGLGEALGSALVLGLALLLALAAATWVLRTRRPAYAGAAGLQPPADTLARAPRQYNPEKVGNDASARPWERQSMAFDAGAFRPEPPPPADVAGPAAAPAWGVPAGFDSAGFVEAARRNFLALQDAWDRADMATLRSMMTDTMTAEIQTQLQEREQHLGGQPNRTEVVMLEARMLGVEDLGADWLASVEFSGLIREQPSAGPSPFREIWNMAKPKDGRTGWLVAGVQALA
jgi:predicted lipid-binding transport protein (Tim44 family)